MTAAENLESLVGTIVRSLVDKPEEVRITSNQGTHTLVVEVLVDQGDVGKVIGKEGKTAYAIRMLLSNVASRHKTQAHLQIVEPDRSNNKRQSAA